mgnify:CR=1 FL=1
MYRRAAEKIGYQLLKILTCELKWVDLEKGSNFDILLYYSEDQAVKMIDDRNIPNMMFFSHRLFEEIPKGVSETRKKSLAYDSKLHEFEPHSIFRFFEKVFEKIISLPNSKSDNFGRFKAIKKFRLNRNEDKYTDVEM